MFLKSFSSLTCLGGRFVTVDDDDHLVGRDAFLERLVSGGRSKMTQCDQVPMGASGSSQMSERPGGGCTPDHSSGGERSEPSQVNVLGMIAPSANAGLLSLIVNRAGSSTGSESVLPQPALAVSASRPTIGSTFRE